MEKIRDLQMATGKHTKTKVADIQRLYFKWIWLVTVVYKPSFTDAKFREYGPKYFVSRDLTCNFSEVVHAFSNVLGEKVSGEAGL